MPDYVTHVEEGGLLWMAVVLPWGTPGPELFSGRSAGKPIASREWSYPNSMEPQRFPLHLSCERKTICNMLFGNWLWQQTSSSYCTLSMLLVL